MAGLWGALQFLTILPISRSTPHLGRCAGWFGWVGLLHGLLGAAVFWLVQQVAPGEAAAAVTVLFWTWFGGGLHEDGLADVADGVRPGRSRFRMLTIMKDSRVGTYGALALAALLLWRWVMISHSGVTLWIALPLARALGETASVAAAYAEAPLGDGLAAGLARDLSIRQVVASAGALVVPLWWFDWRHGLLAVSGAMLAGLLLTRWFRVQLGGVTGDSLGMIAMMVESQALFWMVVR